MSHLPILIVVVIVGAIGFLAFLVYTTINAVTATIDLKYTPVSAVATIDGEVYQAGEITVSPGFHEIKVNKYGFEEQAIAIDVPAGQTTNAYFILESNSDFTANWYATHSEDAIIAEGILGYNTDEDADDVFKKYPALSKLPVKTNYYSFFQTACDNYEVCILIQTDSAHRNEAIAYFRQEIDQDLGRYYFIFSDYHNPFMGEG